MEKNNYKLKDLDKLVSLAKRRGIIFPSSEIYGGLASVWDYGPVGVEIKRNVKNLWWKSFVTERDDIFGLDASILMHPNVWKASGHLDSFSDPLVECSETGKRYREDHIFILEVQTKKENKIISIEANDEDEAKNKVKDKILSAIAEDKAVAIVSDAGTPAISDPGYKLIKLCIRNNYYISAIPGASAAITGLVLSGIPTNRFLFFGFLSSKREKKSK